MTPPPTEIPVPHCPHCSAAMATVGFFSWQNEAGIVLCVYCPNPECNKTLTFQLLPTLAGAGAGPIIDA